jgi:hypothetical protein
MSSSSTPLKTEVDTVKSLLTSTSPASPSSVAVEVLRLFENVKCMVYDDFDRRYALTSHVNTSSDGVDYLIKLPMHLSNIIMMIPPRSFSDDASGVGLRQAVDGSNAWLNLHEYHARLFSHLIADRPHAVERFTYYNLCGSMLDSLWKRMTDEEFDRAMRGVECCAFNRPLQTLYVELALRLGKGGCPSEKVKVRSVKLMRSLKLQPKDVVRVATCSPRLSIPQRSTWVLVSSLTEEHVLECLKVRSDEMR